MSLLVVIEGIDGTGKTTQVQMLVDHLEKEISEMGLPGVFSIAEPTGSIHGKKIRQAMMEGGQRIPFHEELELFLADRRINVEKNIKPRLEKGFIVVLDRYYFSTAAYQGARGFMDYKTILNMNEVFAPKPSMVFFIRLPVSIALDRIDADSGRESRSYMEKRQNLEGVQGIFNKIHESGDYNSFMIDGTKSKDQVHQEIWSRVAVQLDSWLLRQKQTQLP